MKKLVVVEPKRTIMIGTCRIKRPRRLFSDEVRSRASIVDSHVHYPAEILQMVLYLRGELVFPDAVIPWVINGVISGAINSREELRDWRNEAQEAFDRASQVILEVSSLKKIALLGKEDHRYFANITNSSKILDGACNIEFGDITSARAAFPAPTTVICSSEEFTADLQALLEYLNDKKIVLIPHFQVENPKTGNPIAERVELARLVKQVALDNGCEYFDQTQILNGLGAAVALNDTSHYTDAGEQAMATALAAIIASPMQLKELE